MPIHLKRKLGEGEAEHIKGHSSTKTDPYLHDKLVRKNRVEVLDAALRIQLAVTANGNKLYVGLRYLLKDGADVASDIDAPTTNVFSR